MAELPQSDAAIPVAERNPGGTRPSAGIWRLAGTITLISSSCFHFPQATLNSGMDPSWMAVLVYAYEKGMQFGRDIVYTYGPLGFLSVECFTPHAAVLRILFEIIFGAGIGAGLSLLAWRMSLPWRLMALGFFVFVSSPAHWGGDALFSDLGLFAWGLLCLLEN